MCGKQLNVGFHTLLNIHYLNLELNCHANFCTHATKYDFSWIRITTSKCQIYHLIATKDSPPSVSCRCYLFISYSVETNIRLSLVLVSVADPSVDCFIHTCQMKSGDGISMGFIQLYVACRSHKYGNREWQNTGHMKDGCISLFPGPHLGLQQAPQMHEAIAHAQKPGNEETLSQWQK